MSDFNNIDDLFNSLTKETQKDTSKKRRSSRDQYITLGKDTLNHSLMLVPFMYTNSVTGNPAISFKYFRNLTSLFLRLPSTNPEFPTSYKSINMCLDEREYTTPLNSSNLELIRDIKHAIEEWGSHMEVKFDNPSGYSFYKHYFIMNGFLLYFGDGTTDRTSEFGKDSKVVQCIANKASAKDIMVNIQNALQENDTTPKNSIFDLNNLAECVNKIQMDPEYVSRLINIKTDQSGKSYAFNVSVAMKNLTKPTEYVKRMVEFFNNTDLEGVKQSAEELIGGWDKFKTFDETYYSQHLLDIKTATEFAKQGGAVKTHEFKLKF